MSSSSEQHHQASKGAQFVAEVLRTLAPHTAEINSLTHRKVTDEWLERLEKHATTVVSPLIEQILANSEPPAEVAKLLDAAKQPSAQFGASIQQFFVFGLMFTLGQAMLAPFVQEVQNNIWHANPDRPLSPAEISVALTQAVNFGDSQGVEIPQWAIDEAAKSGIDPERFATLVGIDGQAPNPTDLFEMFRRGIINTKQLQDGFLEGPTKNKWIPYLTKLQYVPATIDEMVRAAVQEQLPYAEAADLAHKLGLEPPGWIQDNPDWFEIMYHNRGRPPGPVELGEMANRGIIDWEGTGPDKTTFQQGIAESDVKTKWTDALRERMAYQPPNEQIGTLVRHGGLSLDQAVALWKKNGVPEELAKAYAHLAQVEQVTQDRALAKGEILTLVTERMMSDEDAKVALGRIGYSGDIAEELIGIAHFRYEADAIRTLVRRVSTLFTARKITAEEATQALEAIGLPPTNTADLLHTLTIQRDTQVQVPTAGQITGGLHYGIIDQPTAMTMLEALGYTPWAAWFVLSERMHGPLPDEPPRQGVLR